MTEQTEPKPKKQTKPSTEAIRVKKETKKKVLTLLSQANKKDFGRPITPDALIGLAITLVTDAHLESLKDQSLSNKDRLEKRYQDYCRGVSKVTRDEFYGLLLRGEVPSDGPQQGHGSNG